MSKHTPGPWRLDESGSIVDATNTLICTNGLAACTGYIPPDDVARFNDRLIAAAPELLAACKLAMSTAYTADIQEEYPGCWISVMRDAIAKAEGQAK